MYQHSIILVANFLARCCTQTLVLKLVADVLYETIFVFDTKPHNTASAARDKSGPFETLVLTVVEQRCRRPFLIGYIARFETRRVATGASPWRNVWSAIDGYWNLYETHVSTTSMMVMMYWMDDLVGHSRSRDRQCLSSLATMVRS